VYDLKGVLSSHSIGNLSISVKIAIPPPIAVRATNEVKIPKII
jgi:hypothetical protein